MRIGYVLPNSWGLQDPQDDVDLAVLAEQVGADSLWTSHHVIHTGFVAERLGTGNYYDPIVSLAAAAAATTRPRLGTSVLVLGYLNPFVTAKQLATVDWLSHGRLDVGVGAGALRPEFEALGAVPFDARGRYADEFIDVMRLLWTPGKSSYHGTFFSFDGVEAYPGPYREGGLPILVGGQGPAALRRCVLRGDGWQGVGVAPAEAAAFRQTLAGRLASAGRNAAGLPFQVRLHVDAADLDGPAWQRKVAAYAEAGVTDLVFAPQSREKEAHRRWLEALVPLLAAAG